MLTRVTEERPHRSTLEHACTPLTKSEAEKDCWQSSLLQTTRCFYLCGDVFGHFEVVLQTAPFCRIALCDVKTQFLSGFSQNLVIADKNR